MNNYMKMCLAVSFFVAGSALGVSYAPGAFDQKIKTFKNQSGQSVIGVVRTSEMTLQGPIVRELRTGVIQPGGQEVIKYTTPGTMEIRFEYISSGKSDGSIQVDVYTFGPEYKQSNISEYTLQSDADFKPWERESRIKIVETPNVDKRPIMPVIK